MIFYNRFLLTKSKYVHTVFFSSQVENIARKDVEKVINVAIIGAPNSGKSTLINNIVERKICAASNKVHTTTKLIRAMCFENETQIIFLDTPGIVTEKEQQKYKLPTSMIGACHKSMRCADVVGVVHDVSNKWTKDKIHKEIIDMLQTVENIPSFLIINKIDKLQSKKQLLTIIRNLTNGYISGNPIPGAEKIREGKQKIEKGYGKFSDVFLVSALNGDGVKDIKDYLLNNAKPASPQYFPDLLTDQAPETLILETVRAKFLDFLSQEIPYSLNIELDYCENLEDDKILSSVIVECPSERLVRLIRGAGNGRLQQIKTCIRNDLMDVFKKTVIIDIVLKVKNKNLE